MSVDLPVIRQLIGIAGGDSMSVDRPVIRRAVSFHTWQRPVLSHLSYRYSW